MIVQSAAEGQPQFVITQIDHARASGQLAAAFGSADFAPLHPREPLLYLVAHHDEGWAQVDAQAEIDPATRLPYHLTKTPILKLIETGDKSPNHNEAHHPYSGLLSSMHTYGLYHGRYGLSDKVFIDAFPSEHRPAVDAMLASELARQARIKAQLAGDPATAEWVREEVLFHNYKLLQFFDTLALYFHMVHSAARGEATFKNVPRGVGDDVTLTIKPLGNEIYQLAPYPFAQPQIEMQTCGRYLSPLQDGADLADVLKAAPLEMQIVKLVAQ